MKEPSELDLKLRERFVNIADALHDITHMINDPIRLMMIAKFAEQFNHFCQFMAMASEKTEH